MKVLFVGNSYTFFNDLPALFEKLAAENGHEVWAGSVTQGGRKLIAYEKDDEYTRKLEQALRENAFDVVFVQEQSMLPARDYEAFYRGLCRVLAMVGERAKRVILYATWGRKAGSPELAEQGWTHESMTQLLAQGYARAAQAKGLEVSYVGLAFQRALQADGALELYDPDMSHPSYTGSCLAALVHYKAVFGALPGSADSLGLDERVLAALMAAAE